MRNHNSRNNRTAPFGSRTCRAAEAYTRSPFNAWRVRHGFEEYHDIDTVALGVKERDATSQALKADH